jgi:hypothetical protein
MANRQSQYQQSDHPNPEANRNRKWYKLSDSSAKNKHIVPEREDWHVFLHSLWLDIIKSNPGLYDDAKRIHTLGECHCGCTSNSPLMEKKNENDDKPFSLYLECGPK